jgi:hypothetical protein
MDGQRFDRLARGLAAGTSRRGVMRGLAAAVTAGALARVGRRQVSGQELLAPGEQCTSTQQCDQFGGPQACADNGIAEDGALNCCRIQAGACIYDRDCCGMLYCVDGFCLGESEATTSGGGLPLGSECTENGQCAAVGDGRVICGDNFIAEDGPLNCCLEEGSSCSDSFECCGMYYCQNGRCGSAEGGDLAPGEICITSDQCSQALGPSRCGLNGSAATPICCLDEASPCTNDLECCDDYVCADNGISGDGGLNCCGYAGTSCSSDASCCADLFCQGGTCLPL